MINKLSALVAIQILINDYKEGKHSDSMRCPLCKLFYKDCGTFHQKTSECTQCPNVTFAIDNHTRGCYQRASVATILNCRSWYPTLTVPINQPVLAEYWQKIYDVIAAIPGEEYELTFQLKEQILSIAKSYID